MAGAPLCAVHYNRFLCIERRLCYRYVGTGLTTLPGGAQWGNLSCMSYHYYCASFGGRRSVCDGVVSPDMFHAMKDEVTEIHLHFTRHTSHVTRHTSHDTRHTSHVTYHTLEFCHHLPLSCLRLKSLAVLPKPPIIISQPIPRSKRRRSQVPL